VADCGAAVHDNDTPAGMDGAASPAHAAGSARRRERTLAPAGP